jgi:hypothetical protein
MSVPFLGAIPIDSEIGEACDAGRAFVALRADTPTARVMREYRQTDPKLFRGGGGRTVSTLAWIATTGLLMSAISLVGSVTLLLPEATLRRILMPLVALAPGRFSAAPFST